MRKFRVLHLHTLPVVSGSGLNTFYTMNGLDRSHFDVTLACNETFSGGTSTKSNLISLCQDNEIPVIPMNHLVQPISPWNDVMAVIETYRILKSHHIDIIHTHNSKAGFTGRLAARIAGTPHIVHTIHGFAFHDEEPWLKRWVFILLERWAARWAHALIFISHEMVRWAITKKIVRKNDPRIHVIYSGIDLSEINKTPNHRDQIRTKFKIGDQMILIGCVAKLWPGKGHEYLIRAMPKVLESFSETRLIIVGEGPTREFLENLTHQLNLKSTVIFTGFRDDTSQLLQAIDISVLPSLFEGMGRVILESFAVGIPVIATDVGGMKDLVQNNVNGFLVPPKDTDAIARHIIDLIQHPEKRRVMGSHAKEFAKQPQFDKTTMVQQIEEVYHSLIH